MHLSYRQTNITINCFFLHPRGVIYKPHLNNDKWKAVGITVYFVKDQHKHSLLPLHNVTIVLLQNHYRDASRSVLLNNNILTVRCGDNCGPSVSPRCQREGDERDGTSQRIPARLVHMHDAAAVLPYKDTFSLGWKRRTTERRLPLAAETHTQAQC